MSLFSKVFNKLYLSFTYATNTMYESWMRKRIKNKDFTLITSNCIGGIIYHRLGLKFLSPTINLWMNQRDCIKLAGNIANYREKRLRFVNSEFDYPVAVLDDIKIYFNHYSDEQSAAKTWYKRMERVNPNNMFVIIYDREQLSDQEIQQVRELPCKAAVVLSDVDHLGAENVIKIKPSGKPNGQQFLDRRWHGLHTFETQFDFVKWLNQ